MSIKGHNNQIIHYLLGSLPAEEAEHFDELSFTDDEFAEQLKVAEKDLIDAFIHDELTGEHLEKFNSYYLTSPLRREKVEFAKAFQVYAKNNVAVEETIEPQAENSGFFSAIINFISGNKVQLGFAATILFLILGGLWVYSRRETQPKIETAHITPTPIETNLVLENTNSEKEITSANNNENISITPKIENKNTNLQTNRSTPTPKPSVEPKPVIASFVLTPPLRGSSQTISIPKGTSLIAVQLELEADDYSSYQVSLLDESGKNLWQSGKLKSVSRGENKYLPLRFPAKLLSAQNYLLAVSGIKPDKTAEIIADYPFRAVLK